MSRDGGLAGSTGGKSLPEEIDADELRRQWNQFRKLPEYSALVPFIDKLEPFLNVGKIEMLVCQCVWISRETQINKPLLANQNIETI